MVYQYSSCPICGSSNIEKLKEVKIEEDIFFDYICKSCLEKFSSTNKSKPNEIVNQNNKNNGKDIFKKNIDKVVQLNGFFGDITSAGTGFFISNEYLITNAHVITVETTKNDIFVLSDKIIGKTNNINFFYEFEFISMDKQIDIAILKINNSKIKGIKLKEVAIETGEEVYIIGNTKGEGLCIQIGIVGDFRRKFIDREYILLSALASNGNSGGPVFNSNNEIVGMLTLGRKDVLGMHYAIPVDVIIEYIKEVEIREEIKIL